MWFKSESVTGNMLHMSMYIHKSRRENFARYIIRIICFRFTTSHISDFSIRYIDEKL